MGLLFLSLCLVTASVIGWKAVSSDEDRLWHGLGALGWVILSLSGVTDGLVKIGVTGVALVVFILSAVFSQTSLGQNATAPR